MQAHRIHRSTAGHAGPVYACARAGVNKGYLTAGKDGFIMLWDPELQKLKQVRERGTDTLRYHATFVLATKKPFAFHSTWLMSSGRCGQCSPSTHGSTQFGIFEAHPASSVLHSVCAVRSACKFVACTRAGEVYEVARDRWVYAIVPLLTDEVPLICAVPPERRNVYSVLDDVFWGRPRPSALRQLRRLVIKGVYVTSFDPSSVCA